MEKISFTLTDDETAEFFVLEQTMIAGVNYILVTDSEDEEAEALILKDLSADGETEAHGQAGSSLWRELLLGRAQSQVGNPETRGEHSLRWG